MLNHRDRLEQENAEISEMQDKQAFKWLVEDQIGYQQPQQYRERIPLYKEQLNL